MSEAVQLFLGGIAAGVALSCGSACLIGALLLRRTHGDTWLRGDEQTDIIGGEHGNDRG
ncbi:hypothetical protein [Sphingomonas sp. KC8]|uniref:hypothetical protein n=1 Tax=Sphingomonas sp. KC8 TaxID=1030157 RepID=UPI000A31C31A|nr:hypothetical protein [Sphingomonas sp. KC8]ARS27630.1 hypothetical protein KC8_10030 [Sphingomonas sp. KC8]